MHKVDVKPMSVNLAWQGKRFKTKQYSQYRLDVMWLLPAVCVADIPEGPLSVYYEFGFSNKLADWDNPIKPFQDILQDKYGFNDSRIMEAHVKKVIVKKGEEYIKFEIRGMKCT